MKVLVLYARLSGYITACIQALMSVDQVNCMVVARKPSSDAPFDASTFDSLGNFIERDRCEPDRLKSIAMEFDPDVILVSGWSDPVYVAVCRTMSNRGSLVISGMDNQWLGSLRQLAAVAVSDLYLKRFVDILWVPGARQTVYANKLGYRGGKCWEGLYTCDDKAFDITKLSEVKQIAYPTRNFLFVGRYVREKGLEDLVNAYREYRLRVAEPWGLVCSGAGPLKGRLNEIVHDIGFTQPKNLPQLMATSTVFVLPSHYEPWGVVVHEAASMGLPIVVSDNCGAGDHIVSHGESGLIFESGNESQLADCLVKMHLLTDGELDSFSSASLANSGSYSVSKWVDIFLSGVKNYTNKHV